MIFKAKYFVNTCKIFHAFKYLRNRQTDNWSRQDIKLLYLLYNTI